MSTPKPGDPRLAAYADHVDRLEWAALIIDSDWRLVWVANELQAFLGDPSEEEIGIGKHILEALTGEAWLAMIHPEGQVELFNELAPFIIEHFRQREGDPAEVIPERLLPLLDGIQAKETPDVWSGSFQYIDPRSGDSDLPDYGVNILLMRIDDGAGGFGGGLMLSFMAVRPNLVALLARGDEQMYERMARLVEPSRRQAAVLFCDLHQSGKLSRQLPSSSYFSLIRKLWTGIDEAVANETGIVGKHAGDGASAFFLVDDLGSPSAAAAAAVRAARRIHEISEQVFHEALATNCMMKIGLHWGSSLYMGQLVPGGRLDVTALGDEVNEAARLQDAAGPGKTLASKQLLEQLSPEDAASAGLNVDTISYRLVSELDSAPEKSVRDAGAVAVTTV